MKNNLFLTTALVATTFVAGNAMAEYLEIHSGAISQETADYTSDHDTSDTRISFVKTGEESQVDVELTGDVAMGTYVTLHDKTNITSDDEGTKTLTVSGYLTETAAGSDISGVDLKMQKGSVKNSEAETVEEGELVLGNNLRVGNVNMTNGTGIFSLGDTEKTLTVAEDKVLTFEGNNYITSNANGALTIGGAVENQGALALHSNTSLLNGIAGDGSISVDVGKTLSVLGGTIANAVSGEGTLSISGNVTSDAVLSAANIAVADSGILKTDASNLASENVVANSGTVALTGGTLTQAISGGITNITGNVALGDSLDFGAGAVNVAEGATLDAGSNSLTTSEAVNFAAGSTLAFNADGSQKQVINGTANLKGNVAVNATYAAGVNSSSVKIAKTIADTSEDESGQFTVTGNNLYNVSIDEEGNLVAEKKSGSEIVASTGANSNEAGTITALTQATSSNPILNNIINNVNEMLQSNNAGDVRVALDAVTALAPEVTPVAQQTQTENINQVFGAISTRMSGGSVASRAEGKSSGDELFENGAMWVQMLYNHADKDNTRKAKGYKADSTGVAFGFEKQINDAVKAGIGYAYTKTDVDGFKRDTDIDTHTAFVYGEYKPSPWFVNAVASYNWSDYDEKKYVFNNKVTAGYDVESFGLQAMTGYDMNLCNGTIFTPEAGLRYVHMMQDGYKDKAGQYVYGNDSDLLTGVVGAKVSHDFELENGWNLRPEFRLAATYDISSDDGNSLVSLANGSAYSVKGEKLDRLGMEAELGITADVTDDVSVSLGYQGRFRDHYEDHTGLINAKFKF